jgi:hypothetical protein
MMAEHDGLAPLTLSTWPAVHALMRARDFPAVPAAYAEAAVAFAKVRLFGLYDAQGALQLVCAFGPATDGVAFVDVVCAAEMAGRWATVGRLRGLYRLAFEELQLRAVWAQVHGAAARKAALQAGFVGLPGSDIVVLTPRLVRKRWRDNKMMQKEL